MDTNRKEVVLINTGKCGISLCDVNDRFFTISLGSRLRVSESSLRDIIDYAPSRELLLGGYVKMEGATREMFEDCGLTDNEITILVGEKEVKEPENIEEENEEIVVSPEVLAVTYHNWLKNKKYDKIKDSLSNETNLETLKGVLKKKKEYNTDEINEILAEVE